jgi:cell pole-organizing protein PopZ
MSTPAKAHEPTMEEILASIRRIISDDEPAAAKPAEGPVPAGAAKPGAAPKPAPTFAPVPEALAQDDIDEMFAASDKPQAAAPEPKPVAERRPASAEPLPRREELDVLELTDAMQDQPPPAAIMRGPVRAAPPPAGPPAPSAAAAPDRLLSEESDDAVSRAFGTLSNTVLSNNARTIDDLVRDMLRPMLRAWLDDNLPPLVERLVRQEIERVARGGR